MPSPTTHIGTILTKTVLLANAELPLGFTVLEPADTTGVGDKEWIYVYNDEAANSFVQGTVVARDTVTAEYHCIICPTSQPTIRVVGVAQHTILAGYCGFVLRRGIGEVLADTGGITQDTAILSGNAVAGRADNVAAVTDHAFGLSTETVLATALATCHINCPG